MIKGKTTTGFEFEYDSKYLKDWEYVTKQSRLLELLEIIQVNEKDSSASAEAIALIDGMLNLLIGKIETKKLIVHVRENNEEGIADIKSMLQALNEITGAAKEKNSSSLHDA